MKFTFPPESKPLDGYTIKRAIHRGGFGEVYYALSDGGKEVALKLLQHNMDVELRGVSQCLNLKHPNLVNIFDIRTDGDGDHWIVMEYVSGRSLDVVMSDQAGPMPVDAVLGWLEGMAAGLSFLHDRGIVHRDLKPANIYREQSVVKIGDVGLAKYISESRRSAQTESVGTVYYMAPEVARGRYGREVDIYSLGIMLYEMLTGDVPFDGESTAEILMKHLSEAQISPLPVALRPVLANALAKDPMRRTPSAAQLLDEFHQALAGIEVAAEIPEDSFIGETVTDSSVAIREQAEKYDEFVLRLPKGSGKKLRRAAYKARKQFQRVAHHAGVEARKAAEQARREAREALKFAQKRRSWDRRAAVNGRNAGHHEHGARHHRGPQNGYPHVRHERKSGRFAPWVYILAISFIALTVTAPGVSLKLFAGTVALGMYAALGYGIYRLIAHFSSPEVGPSNAVLAGSVAAEPVFEDVEPAATVVHAVATPVVAAHPAATAIPVHRTNHVVTRRIYNPTTARALSGRARLTDLTGSMTKAAFLTLLLTVGMYLLATPFANTAVLAGLFGLTTLLASWSLIFSSKVLEGRSIDSGARRFIQLGMGVLVGMAAYGLQTNLLAVIPSGHDMVEAAFTDVGEFKLHSRYQPTMAGYMVFFGALFGVRRWWWLCDSFRKKRLRVMSVLFTAGVAVGLSFLWAFPKDWAILWAVGISSIVQLASGWVRPEDRLVLVEGKTDDPVA